MAYSEEDTEKLIRIYTKADDKDEAVATLTELLGKSRHSIISKLSNLKVYKSKTQPAGNRDVISKKEIIMNIAELLDADPDYLQGLEKSNKEDLKYLAQRIKSELEYAREES